MTRTGKSLCFRKFLEQTKKSACIFTGAMIGLLGMSNAAEAVILVEPIVTTPNTDFPDGIGIPLDLLPGQIYPFSAPDTSGAQNFLNDSDFTITRQALVLFPDFDLIEEEVVWGDANGDGQIGLSNIFDRIVLNPDFTVPDANFQPIRAPLIQLEQGSIAQGERFSFQIITSPDLTPDIPGDNGPLAIGGIYDGELTEDSITTVPEPSATLAFFTLLLCVAGTTLPKRLNLVGK